MSKKKKEKERNDSSGKQCNNFIQHQYQKQDQGRQQKAGEEGWQNSDVLAVGGLEDVVDFRESLP